LTLFNILSETGRDLIGPKKSLPGGPLSGQKPKGIAKAKIAPQSVLHDNRDGNQIKAFFAAPGAILVSCCRLLPLHGRGRSSAPPMVTPSACSTTGDRRKYAPGVATAQRRARVGTKAKHATSVLVLAEAVEVESATTDRSAGTVAFVGVGDTLARRGWLGCSRDTATGRFTRGGRHRGRRDRTRRRFGIERCGRQLTFSR
jgi:hypothetical protein